MDREQLALSLKLPKESSEAAIFEALAKRDAEGRKAVESFAKVASQLPGFGLKLDAEHVLSRVEPVSLDLQDDPSDTPKEAALKKQLREAQQASSLAAAAANKEFVDKLSKEMKLPPAMKDLAEEFLSIDGGAEAVFLSKDGKSVDRRKIASIREKAKTLLSSLSSIGGVKFPTPDSKSDVDAAKAEREKLAKEMKDAAQPVEMGKK